MTTLTANTGELQTRVLQIAGSVRPGAFKFPIKAISNKILSDVKSNFDKGTAPNGTRWRALAHGRPTGGTPLPLRNNGVLLASLTTKETANSCSTGTNLIYAGIHQFGGIIRPVKAKLLAIPATREAQLAGSPRRFKRPLKAIIGKSGNGVLVEVSTAPAKKKKSAAITKGPKPKVKTKPETAGKVQFYLVKEVKIPARPYLGFSPGLLDWVDKLLIDEARKAINGG